MQFFLAVTCEPWLLHWSTWTCPFHQPFQQPRFARIQEKYVLQLFMFMCTLLCKLHLACFITEVEITFCACVHGKTLHFKGLSSSALCKGILELWVKWSPSRCLHLPLCLSQWHTCCAPCPFTATVTCWTAWKREMDSFFQKAAGKSL